MKEATVQELRGRLRGELITPAESEALRAAAAEEVEAAVQFGRQSPLPAPDEALDDLYAGQPV